MNRRATIHDVARAAGVSVATVSKTLNGRDGVAAATHARVLSAVEELGYSSSLVATSMRRGRTNVIGVLVAEFEPFALQLLRGVSQALENTEYDVLAYAGSVSSGDHLGWERRSLSRLGGTLIDGAILVTPTTTSPLRSSVPLVAIDPHTGTVEPASISVRSFEGARDATAHLISLGHRRIGHLRGRNDLASAQDRERGYRTALADAGIAVDESLIVNGGYRAADSTAGAHQLLQLQQRPTAVFAANDASAIELMRVAGEHGLLTPEDLSVIGFDDIPEAASHTPPLTTVRQPLSAMGSAAVDLLLRMLDGGEPEQVQMPTELVHRATTAPAR